MAGVPAVCGVSPTIHPNLVGVDLTRPNRAISTETGVSDHYIRQARKALGVPAPSRKGSGRLADADLSRPTSELMATYGVASSTVRKCRASRGLASPGGLRGPTSVRPGKLADADLTRPTAELMAEYGACKQAISALRKARGIPAPRRVRTKRVPVPRVKPPPIPRPVKVAPVREIRVVAPPPIVAEDAIVAALEDELVVCRSAYSAALVVSARLKRPMDEMLTVAERLMGRAA